MKCSSHHERHDFLHAFLPTFYENVCLWGNPKYLQNDFVFIVMTTATVTASATPANNLALRRSLLLASEASPRFSYISTSLPLCTPSSAVTSVLPMWHSTQNSCPQPLSWAQGLYNQLSSGYFHLDFLLTPVAQDVYNWSYYLSHPICSLLFTPYNSTVRLVD